VKIRRLRGDVVNLGPFRVAGGQLADAPSPTLEMRWSKRLYRFSATIPYGCPDGHITGYGPTVKDAKRDCLEGLPDREVRAPTPEDGSLADVDWMGDG
jgi:hypothetical protein